MRKIIFLFGLLVAFAAIFIAANGLLHSRIQQEVLAYMLRRKVGDGK